MKLFVALLLCWFPLTLADMRCCGDYGCFSDDPPFGHMPVPECPSEIEVSTRVYTRDNWDEGQVLTTTTIPPVYDGNRRTIFILHGWVQGTNWPWMRNMKDAFLAVGDYNVIVTGWAGGSQNLWYPQCASNTRVVGAVLGRTAQLLIDRTETTSDKLWCVGHSLGAHACGHAGSNAHFGRITGLDPAGPWFENHDLAVGINPTTADLVDIHHTNGDGSLGLLGLGIMKSVGHLDFYPNGGETQPGCILDPPRMQNMTEPTEENMMRIMELMDGVDLWDLMEGVVPHIDLTPVCSHLRVIRLWIESISNLDCIYYGRQVCTNEYDLPGSCSYCGEECAVMGWQADQYTQLGNIYLETNKARPFCLG